MKINKKRLICELNRRDYIRELHDRMLQGLVGSFQSEYMGNINREIGLKQVPISPILRTVVNVLLANLINSEAEKISEQIIDVINDCPEIIIKDPS